MDGFGSYRLEKACRERAPLNVIQALVEEDPTALKHSANADGDLPLHIACLVGCSPEVVQYLVEQAPTTLMV